jgi:hypothetical protein
VKNDNMPRVVVPRSHASVSRQAPTLPATSDHVGGYDPYARPAGHVSVEEWRILIASLAGGFRVAQGATREISLAAGVPLFVFGQSRVAPAIYRIGGDSASTNGTTGIAVLNQFEQVLLPRERLYAFSVGALTLDVTTLTI